MSDSLLVDIVLNKNNYGRLYKLSYIIIGIIFVLFIIIVTFKYQTYLILKARMINNTLEVIIDGNSLKYIHENHTLYIDNKSYFYRIKKIDNQLYVSSDYQNYLYIYLEVYELKNIDNYLYQIKILKENKVLAAYISDYLF